MNLKPKPILLFETIRVENGKAQHLFFHEKRIKQSISSPLMFDLATIIQPKNKGLYRCKVIYDTSGCLHNVAFFTYQKRMISSLKVMESDVIYPRKYLNRQALDTLFNAREQADDVLIVRNGRVTDTTIANIAICSNGVWITPKNPLLAGTTRARLLQNGILQARDFGLDELFNASQFALMNAMIGFDKLENIVFQAA